MIWAGSMGLGAVWGWYLALYGRPVVQRPIRHYTLTVLYTVALVVLLYFSTPSMAIILFFIGLIISFIIHRMWQRDG